MAAKKTTKTAAETKAAAAEAKTEAVEAKAETAAPVEEKKPTAKKACTKKPCAKINIALQYADKEYTIDSIVEKIKAVESETVISTLDVYVVPEKSTVYYVVNGEEKSIEL